MLIDFTLSVLDEGHEKICQLWHCNGALLVSTVQCQKRYYAIENKRVPLLKHAAQLCSSTSIRLIYWTDK